MEVALRVCGMLWAMGFSEFQISCASYFMFAYETNNGGKFLVLRMGKANLELAGRHGQGNSHESAHVWRVGGRYNLGIHLST